MSTKKALTTYQAASRISDRKDNIYHPKVIAEILNMYMDECKKELIKGGRVQLSGIGTIIPEVKTHRHFNLPFCNKEDGNLPYTGMKITRTNSLGQEMNKVLIKNIQNGILGLEELPFSKQQITILRNDGMIPNDENEQGEE